MLPWPLLVKEPTFNVEFLFKTDYRKIRILEQASLLNFTLLTIILFPDHDIHVLCNVSIQTIMYIRKLSIFGMTEDSLSGIIPIEPC